MGAALGMVTAVLTAAFLLFFRAAAEYGERNTITFAMLLGAAVFNSSLALARVRQTPPPNRTWYTSAIFLAVMTLVGTWCLAGSLPRVSAGVMSTILQLQIFFVAGGAWMFLRERVRAHVLVGAAMAIGGFAFYALPSSSSTELDLLGLLGGLATGLAYGSMMVWTRAVIRDLEPVSLNAGRLWIAVAMMALVPGTLIDAMAMPLEGWLLTAGAAASGPFVARLAVMYALRYISAANTKLWSMLSPVFAFLLVFLIYGDAPGYREVVGGLFIIVGVLLPTLSRLRTMHGAG